MKKTISTGLLALALITPKTSMAMAAFNPISLTGIAIGAFFTGGGAIMTYQGITHPADGIAVLPGIFSFFGGVLILDSENQAEGSSVYFKRIEAQSKLALSLSEDAQDMIPLFNESVPFVNLALDQLIEFSDSNKEVTESDIQKAFQKNLAQLGVKENQIAAISLILEELGQRK
ncbi:MAG: hypothetical protein KDD61_15185 [Bdellovibrionales bacterium]|nr:hypothetical protein [Bdellovibrionales bacterium]